jgi:hypothetical protein
MSLTRFQSGRKRLCLRLALALAVTAMALGGCADGVGTIFADPGRYSAFHCNDMVSRWSYLNTREKQLAGLMTRASEGPGGTVIGTMAYRPEYEQVLTERHMLQRAAAEKKCDLQPPSKYQSDNTIR